MKSFSLEIVTPEKLFYWGDAEIVIAKTLSGEEGFMAGHVWACKLLATGELWFREAGAKEYRLAAISGGFIDVRGNILVFTDSAEWPDDIDVERVDAAIKREQEWLEEHSGAGAGGTGAESEEETRTHKNAAKRAENRKNVLAGGVRQRK